MMFFRARAAQKFLPGRRIEKQVADDDLRARRTARRTAGNHFPALNDHFTAFRGILLPGPERDPGHRSDARQRLAAKPHGRDREKVGFRLDLAGGVRLETQQGVIRVHAVSVIHHRDHVRAGFLDPDRDLVRMGVQRIFQQFLQHGSGAFHHFTRCDFIVDLFRQQIDPAHGCFLWSPAAFRSLASFTISRNIFSRRILSKLGL